MRRRREAHRISNDSNLEWLVSSLVSYYEIRVMHRVICSPWANQDRSESINTLPSSTCRSGVGAHFHGT